MLDTIEPGSRIVVTVVKTPRRASAVKTIVRLLSRDESVKRENKRLTQIRHTHLRHKQRGGRLWAVRVVKQRPVKGQAGDVGTITATLDVLKDLRSVRRFVEMTTEP